MEIVYAPRALRELSALPRQAQERIVRKIHFYATQPDPLRFAKHLQGCPAYRFHVGSYRVIFKTSDDALHIIKVGKRSEIYDNL